MRPVVGNSVSDTPDVADLPIPVADLVSCVQAERVKAEDARRGWNKSS